MARVPLRSPGRARLTPLLATALLTAALAPLSAPPGHAYEVDTHRAVSNVALRRPDCVADDYLKNQLLLSDGYNTATSNGTLADRLEAGAEHEDTETLSRPRNHFYNPVTNGGLNDIFSGTSSLLWAYDHPDNQLDWRAAREAYERSFTAGSKTQRLTELGNAFFALGHVIHLVQDCGQPQHTRNDAHITYFPGAPYEDYCHAHFGNAATISLLPSEGIPAFNGGSSPFDGIPGSFASYWDTGQYFGQADFAGFGGTPGLAEYSNAYFLTDDTMFGTFRMGLLNRPNTTRPLQVRLTEALENHSTSANHRFANPALRSTDLTSFYPDSNVRRITLQREGEDLAGAVHYLTLQQRDAGGNVVHTTPHLCLINNSNEIGFNAVTYQTYAEMLLPKAVAYSAGVLNYFFRGKLDLQVRWQEGAQQYQVTVTNRSGYDLGAGTWKLYQDDQAENRSEIPATFNYGGSLADGGSFTATFAATSRPGPYTVVFKGTVGDEADLGVIGKRFEIVRVHITWTPRSDQDIYMWGPGGSLISYFNLATSNGELDNDNIGVLGPENITLKDLSPGTYTFMINYYRDWWREKFYDSPSATCQNYGTPLNTPDDLTFVCHTQTPIQVTVNTFHNSSAPVRTVTRTLNEQNYGDFIPADGSPEGAVGDEWFVTQIVQVDDQRHVTVVGASKSPTTLPGLLPAARRLTDWKAPRKPEPAAVLESEVRR